MKATCYPFPFPWLHLGLGSQPRQTYTCIPGCTAPAGTHPGMPIIVMRRETCGDSWLSNQNSACRHQPKGAAVLWRQYLEGDEQHSWASLRWFMHAATGALRVVTETNMLSTVEGSRLLWRGCTRHANTFVATMSDHSKILGDRTNPPMQHPAFIQNGHMTCGMCMANDITSDVTVLHHENKNDVWDS